MIAEQVARIIAVFALFLETTDEDKLDPDEAVEVMEYIGKLMDEFDKGFLRELIDAFATIAPNSKAPHSEWCATSPSISTLKKPLRLMIR